MKSASVWFLNISLLLLPALAQDVSLNNAPPSSFHIAGTAVDAVSGQPLSHIQVTIMLNKDAQAARNTVTGNNGRFEFGNLPPGKYALSGHGRHYSAQGYEQHDNYITAIIVGPALGSADVVLRLQPSCRIDGWISDDEGDPVYNAEVWLFWNRKIDGRSLTTFFESAITKSDGGFSFTSLPAGQFIVLAMPKGSPWYAAAAEEAAESSRRALHDDWEQQHMFQPIVTAQSEDADSDTDSTQDSSAAGEGAGLKSQLPEDDDFINHRDQFETAYPLTYFGNTSDPQKALPITLRPGDRFRADIVFRTQPTVHVTLLESRLPENSHLSNDINVSLMQPIIDGSLVGGVNQFLYSGNRLVYRILPGRYLLTLAHDSSTRSRTIDIDRDIELDGAAEFKTAATLPTVTGTLEWMPGTNPESVVVRLTNPATGETFDTTATIGKQFSFEDETIMKGVYDVAVISHPNDFPKGLGEVHATGAGVKDQTIEISTNPVQLKLTMQGTFTLHGVAMRNGKPGAVAMVLLVPQNATSNRALFRRDQSDSDGTFQFTNVVPGTYTAIAIEEGWRVVKGGGKLDQQGGVKLGQKSA